MPPSGVDGLGCHPGTCHPRRCSLADSERAILSPSTLKLNLDEALAPLGDWTVLLSYRLMRSQVAYRLLSESGRFRVDSQFLINVISRIVHVSTAIALVGGSVFMVFVLLPAAKQLSAEQHERLRGLVNKSWKRYVHVGILLFLVTGFYNYFQQMPFHKKDGLYHGLIGTKIILALVIFFIASVLVGRSAKFEWMRVGREKWLKIIVLLAAMIVGMSGFVKVRGPKEKVAGAQPVGQPVAPSEVTTFPQTTP